MKFVVSIALVRKGRPKKTYSNSLGLFSPKSHHHINYLAFNDVLVTSTRFVHVQIRDS